ncbi:hypothetical protein ACFLQY_02910 [Verrucomicrobiota bacterium]
MMKIYMMGVLAVVCALSAGCTQKSEHPKPEEGVAPSEPSMVESVKEQVAVAQEQVAAKVEEYRDVIVSATRPLSEIKAEAEKLNIDQLKATALEYKDAITAKTAELQPLMEALKEIPMTQMLGEEATRIKDEIAGVKQGVDALKARYDIYVAKLKEMGVDVSTFLK